MPRNRSSSFDERSLTKGQLRKLTALRKSLGDDIANNAFATWLATPGSAPEAGEDRNATMIVETLSELATSGKLSIPRGGYLVRRGRGRFIVERAAAEE